MFRFISLLMGKNYESAEIQLLREQIRFLQEQNEELLHTLIDRTKPEIRPIESAPEPIKPKFVPWSHTQRSLELRDRLRFNEQMKRNNPDIANKIDDLEKELGVDDAKSDAAL